MARQRGYQRIGAALFKHDPYHPDDAALRGAFLNAQHRTLGQVNSSLLFDIPQRTLEPRASVHKRFLNWIHDARPDALFLFSQEQLQWLDELPNRGGVKGYVLQIAKSPDLDLDQTAHVESPWARVAEIAVQWLENAIRLRHYGPQDLPPHGVVESTVIAGPSLPDLH
jgi:hypothetical protein